MCITASHLRCISPNFCSVAWQTNIGGCCSEGIFRWLSQDYFICWSFSSRLPNIWHAVFHWVQVSSIFVRHIIMLVCRCLKFSICCITLNLYYLLLSGVFALRGYLHNPCEVKCGGILWSSLLWHSHCVNNILLCVWPLTSQMGQSSSYSRDRLNFYRRLAEIAGRDLTELLVLICLNHTEFMLYQISFQHHK